MGRYAVVKVIIHSLSREKNLKKMLAASLLYAYVGFIIYTTLLSRKPTVQYQYNFKLFWSYQRFFDDVSPQAKQIINNILFFIPYGALVLLCVSGNKKKKMLVAVLSACLLSGVIEILQLILKLGFAEFDDIFDNTLGAAVGAGIVLLLSRLVRRFENGNSKA